MWSGALILKAGVASKVQVCLYCCPWPQMQVTLLCALSERSEGLRSLAGGAGKRTLLQVVTFTQRKPCLLKVGFVLVLFPCELVAWPLSLSLVCVRLMPCFFLSPGASHTSKVFSGPTAASRSICFAYSSPPVGSWGLGRHPRVCD